MPSVRRRLKRSRCVSRFVAAATVAESSIGGARDSCVGVQKHECAQRIPERHAARIVLEIALKMQMDRRQVALLRQRWIGATRKARLRVQFARKASVRKIGAMVPAGAWRERRQRPESEGPGNFPRSSQGAPVVRALRQQPRRWMIFTGLVDGALLAVAVNLAMSVRYANDAAAYAAFSPHLPERAALFAGAIVLCMFALGPVSAANAGKAARPVPAPGARRRGRHHAPGRPVLRDTAGLYRAWRAGAGDTFRACPGSCSGAHLSSS
jgi:hypothetical protein